MILLRQAQKRMQATVNKKKKKQAERKKTREKRIGVPESTNSRKTSENHITAVTPNPRLSKLHTTRSIQKDETKITAQNKIGS